VPTWYHGWVECCLRLWTRLVTSHSGGRSTDALVGSALRVKVHCVKTNRMAVFGGGGCAVCSLDPRTLELEYEITDLRGENLFALLPLAAPFLPGT
jgi:hypothetical protein